MASNDITKGNGEFFNSEKPSKLKTAFQYAGAALSTVTGDGTNYGWNQAGAAYDYAKTWLNSKGIGLGKPAAA